MNTHQVFQGADSGSGVDSLTALYFDGRSARGQLVRLWVGAAQLHVKSLSMEVGSTSSPVAPEHMSDLIVRSYPLNKIVWAEKTRHGARMTNLPDGTSLQAQDVAQWDQWVAHQVKSPSLPVRAQQSWRGVAIALVLLILALTILYRWALPVVARGVVAMTPLSIDKLLGEETMKSIDGSLLKPSKLPVESQARLRKAFDDALIKAYGKQVPPHHLEFRTAPAQMGPNAFALPGGTMVLTDALVDLVKDDQVIIGVLGHEIGHVRLRHSMRQLIEVSAIGAVASVAFGDYGTLITTAPVILAQMGYSRDVEREADAESVRVLKANSLSPLVMVKFFEAIAPLHGQKSDKDDSKDDGFGKALGIAIASHPDDRERIDFFRQAAAH